MVLQGTAYPLLDNQHVIFVKFLIGVVEFLPEYPESMMICQNAKRGFAKLDRGIVSPNTLR